ncbi:MAG: hypothetical protein IJ561_04710 [Ruminococcus sp.]|nr:hypothetical protein [Ruminococcus sp.]
MKLNQKLALAKKQLEQMNKRGVKVKIASCGKVLINGLPFSFSAASAGDASNKGIVISFSGEPVEKGLLTFGAVEMHYFRGGKARQETKKLVKVIKKDGKPIYQARFTDAVLEEFAPDGKKADENMFLTDIASHYTFRTTPQYTGEEDAEVMITVYPLEDPLGGLAVEWKPCTTDENWFTSHPEALKTKPKRRFGK